jgi:hypothetical protein
VTVGEGNSKFDFLGAKRILEIFNRGRFTAYPTTHSALLGSSSLLEIRDHIPIARTKHRDLEITICLKIACFENTLSDLRALYDVASFKMNT